MCSLTLGAKKLKLFKYSSSSVLFQEILNTGKEIWVKVVVKRWAPVLFDVFLTKVIFRFHFLTPRNNF